MLFSQLASLELTGLKFCLFEVFLLVDCHHLFFNSFEGSAMFRSEGKKDTLKNKYSVLFLLSSLNMSTGRFITVPTDLFLSSKSQIFLVKYFLYFKSKSVSGNVLFLSGHTVIQRASFKTLFHYNKNIWVKIEMVYVDFIYIFKIKLILRNERLV